MEQAVLLIPETVAADIRNGSETPLPRRLLELAAIKAYVDKPLFMTEFSPSSGPDMFNTAWLIQNALTVEGVAAYLHCASSRLNHA